MSNKEQTDFEKFDKAMSGLLAVPYKELQEEVAKNLVAGGGRSSLERTCTLIQKVPPWTNSTPSSCG